MAVLPEIPNYTGSPWVPQQSESWGGAPSPTNVGASPIQIGTPSSTSLVDFLKGLLSGSGGDGGKDLSTGLGLNIGTGQLALGGLQALGNLWSSFQAQDLAKRQFNFTKDFATANLANQVKSYNTRLDDKITSRAFTEGRPSGWAEDYLGRNRLNRTLG